MFILIQILWIMVNTVNRRAFCVLYTSLSDMFDICSFTHTVKIVFFYTFICSTCPTSNKSNTIHSLS